ncbi:MULTISPECIES: DUF2515 family protein [Neobacillus]|uniref:DUF2515 domain-containing protein n=1 Tax=Neobacillus citreus TaxID=2833578 RepID=A0A942YD37_9BACI|nr:DUF2515 family protein [Neobacillus citreus]MCH6264561.1 DUF2515 domain-containing protein [Neobacillus citreus]
MSWPGIETVKEKILSKRYLGNLNNVTRTYYYLKVYKKHPELAWSLLAHLVSRNAGYQMSDLKRFENWKKIISGAAVPPITGPFLNILKEVFDYISTNEIEAIFAFLETGNFLIYHDVCPQLEAYEWAKQYPDHVDELFDMLLDQPFNIDEFIWESWKKFFHEAETNSWFPNWWLVPEVEAHSYALIINEQNQIEDRLVHDPHNRYIGKFGTVLGPQRIIELMGRFGQTKLLFPVANSLSDSSADNLLIYTVDDFLYLGSRIDTGKNLFAGLFKKTDLQRRCVEFWALSHPVHMGTRTDYNPVNYSTDYSALWPGGQTFSPPVIKTTTSEHGWPRLPGKTHRYAHLHSKPIKLPVPVMGRSEVYSWLSSPASPKPLELKPRSAQDEIFEPIK